MRSLLVASFVTFVIVQVNAWPGGAPEAACNDMIPAGHTGSIIIPGNKSTYTLSATKTANNVAEVTISGSGLKFRGFLVKAKDANGNDIAGSFSGENSQHLECGAATHTNLGQGINSVVLTFTVDQNFQGNVNFKSTIVFDKKNHIVNVVSNSVSF